MTGSILCLDVLHTLPPDLRHDGTTPDKTVVVMMSSTYYISDFPLRLPAMQRDANDVRPTVVVMACIACFLDALHALPTARWRDAATYGPLSY